METYTLHVEGAELVIERYTKDRIEELKERIRTGNKKLNDAWVEILKIDKNPPAWPEALQQWHLATEKLSAYCTQLEGMGFTDC